MAQTLTLGPLTITASQDITQQSIPCGFTATNIGPSTVDLLALSPSEVLVRAIPAGQQALIPAPPQGASWQVTAAPQRQLRQMGNDFGWIYTGAIAVASVGGWEFGKWVGRKLRAHK